MPTPPLPHPTSYTCANCGEALTERAEFCPRCGARMEIKPARSASWIAGTIALGLDASIFGSVGACSAWTGGSILFTGAQDHLAIPILVMFVLPIFLVSGVIAWLCGRALLRRLRG